VYCSKRCGSLAQSNIITQICPICGKEFKSRIRDKKVFCSTECSDTSFKFTCRVCGKEYESKLYSAEGVKSYRKHKDHFGICSKKCRYHTPLNCTCRVCGKKFRASYALLQLFGEFCSQECLNTKIKCKCQYCGKIFYVEQSIRVRPPPKFCSDTCYSKGMETEIERKMRAELKRRELQFEEQKWLKGLPPRTTVDFYLPNYKIVIYCDGDYWHNLEGRPERDNVLTQKLKDNGYVVFRFTEHAINDNVSNCVDTIQEYISGKSGNF
jgi:very-short-patch-repair endonuclease